MSEARATIAEIRKLVAVQVGITALFLLGIFVLLDGLDSDPPAIWQIVLVLVVVSAAAVIGERSWVSLKPLPADVEDSQQAGLDAYMAHTVRTFAICEGAILICVILAFISDTAGWLVAIAGVPGLAVLAFETWPSLRNASLAEVSLDAGGATSGLVDQFVASS